MKITFLGGVQEVTGSRYLIENGSTKILVDCGLFQGERILTERNWQPFAIDPKTIDAVVITHAHIDHTGYIPALIKNGFTGKIYCSQATYELSALMLIDSGSLQEDEAKHRHGASHQAHPEPLYTKLDAQNSLRFFKTVEYDTPIELGGSLQATLIRSGHILGSSFVVITDGKRKLTFSGDLGRPQQPIQKTPPYIKQTDFLVLESTYGDRLHEKGDPLPALAHVINEALKKNGIIIMPCFAVERTQTILYFLYQLKQKKQIPNVPIYLDSPLAIGVTDLFYEFSNELMISKEECKKAFSDVIYTRTVEESKKIDQLEHSAIVIAGSGMADGGRVVHHLKNFIFDPKNTIVFVGYQARATLGSRLIDGAQEVKIYGEWYPVRADIKALNMLSAHADYNEILQWLEHLENVPKKVFLTHGEMESALALQKKIEEKFGWPVVVPKYLESFDLD